MDSNNGWYSVFDEENRPASGEEVLCLGMLDSALQDEEPLADQNNRLYYIATWYNAGDVMMDETVDPAPTLSAEEQLLEKIFGRKTPAPRDGFYIMEPELARRSDTDGGRLPQHSIIYRHRRLHLSGEGGDGLIAWKPLDWPTED